MSGNIDVNELRDAMKALGIYLKRDDVKEMMRKADKDGNGTIDFEEFQELMKERIVSNLF
jgi:Ca2+-binding EF-hand superfamily protein